MCLLTYFLTNLIIYLLTTLFTKILVYLHTYLKDKKSYLVPREPGIRKKLVEIKNWGLLSTLVIISAIISFGAETDFEPAMKKNASPSTFCINRKPYFEGGPLTADRSSISKKI